MNGYLVPANAKKGTLIFNVFRPFDLGLFCILYTVLVIALGNLYITYQSLAVLSFYIFECS